MEVVKVLDFDSFDKILTKKKVCAYAHVSSLNELQETSIVTQVEAYTKMIKLNKHWEFVGVFTDHDKTGTSTEKREQFKIMVQLASTGNIDKIITKSITIK